MLLQICFSFLYVHNFTNICWERAVLIMIFINFKWKLTFSCIYWKILIINGKTTKFKRKNFLYWNDLYENVQSSNLAPNYYFSFADILNTYFFFFLIHVWKSMQWLLVWSPFIKSIISMLIQEINQAINWPLFTISFVRASAIHIATLGNNFWNNLCSMEDFTCDFFLLSCRISKFNFQCI